jgi:hypothetical protein
MPNLQSDFEGLIARLPLRPSEKTALLPLYEAISNGLHAVSERFEESGRIEEGKIEIKLLRLNEEGESNRVNGFTIYDNGIGLTEENFKYFCTPYSQLKILRGPKGVGRLSWVKIFKKIQVQSAFQNGAELKKRAFRFYLRSSDQIEFIDSEAKFDGPGTLVRLEGFKYSYFAKCPFTTKVIIQ